MHSKYTLNVIVPAEWQTTPCVTAMQWKFLEKESIFCPIIIYSAITVGKVDRYTCVHITYYDYQYYHYHHDYDYNKFSCLLSS